MHVELVKKMSNSRSRGSDTNAHCACRNRAACWQVLGERLFEYSLQTLDIQESHFLVLNKDIPGAFL